MNGRNEINSANHEDTLYRSRKRRKVECTGMVLLPRRRVKVAQARSLRSDGPPAASETEGMGTEDDLEGGVDGVAAVVEHFSQGGGHACSPSLFAVDGVHGLVGEESEGPAEVDPCGQRGTGVGRIEDEEGADVEEDEAEAEEGDLESAAERWMI